MPFHTLYEPVGAFLSLLVDVGKVSVQPAACEKIGGTASDSPDAAFSPVGSVGSQLECHWHSLTPMCLSAVVPQRVISSLE